MTGVAFINDFEVTDAQCRDLEALRLLQGEKARLAAREHALLLRIAGPVVQVLEPEGIGSRVSIPDPIRSEICLATGWSERFAAAQLADARVLAAALPLTCEALAAGRISEAHARVMCSTVGRFEVSLAVPSDADDETVAAAERAANARLRDLGARIEALVLPRIVNRPLPVTLSRLRAMCNRAVHVADPQGALQRSAKARADFGVWVVDDADGVSQLVARMSSVAAHACVRRLDAMVAMAQAALRDSAETMAVGQWRVDALETLILGANSGRQQDGAGEVAVATAASTPAGTLPSPTAHIDVVMDLDMLLGLREGTVTMNGVTEIHARIIRDLVAGPDAEVTLRRLVTDPLTGHLLDVGRNSYVPSDRLREYIIVRDGRCRFPGCGRRAANADIDHAVAWDDQGETSRGNLGALCRRHHLLKTHAGYDITDSAVDGSCVWQTPSGAIIHHAPLRIAASAAKSDIVDW